MFPLHEPLTDVLREELATYDDLTAALLARRGILTRGAAERFLNPSYTAHVYDPLLMTDMPKAAKRFAKAILSGEKIAAWTDYDCDGIPAAVILHDFLKKVGANFENYIPHRHDEGYGVNVAGIEKLAKSGVTLVVTADSGITDVDAVKRALADGTADAIATDHAPHAPEAKEGPLDTAAPGMLGLETAVPVCLAALTPDLSLADVLALMSWRPARIAGLAHEQGGDQGGPVATGLPANICVIDPHERWEVDPGRLSSRSRNTPWAGRTLTGQVRHTVYRGEPVVVDAEAQR